MRKIILTAAACAMLFAGAAVAADEDEELVTDSWYLYRSTRHDVTGYIHLTRRDTDDEHTPVVLIADQRFVFRGRPLSLEMTLLCRDNAHLSPVRIVCRGSGGDEFGTFSAVVEDGVLKAEIGKRKIEREMPDGTATFLGLLEIVRRRPFDDEEPFEFHCLEASELNLKMDHRLDYVGEEELSIDGRKQSLHKFKHTGAGSNPAYYWVSEQRELVRVLLDDCKELSLTTEEKAKQALNKALGLD